jgi:hypothetical protein
MEETMTITLASVSMLLGFLVNFPRLNLMPLMESRPKVIAPDHTGATIEFACELADIHKDVEHDLMYGDGWELYAQLSNVEAELSAALERILEDTFATLDVDPRAALSIIGASCG